MKNLNDDRLEELLADYMKAEPQQSFVYDPDHHSEKIIPFALHRKRLVAAASLVLVSVLSLVLYFSFGNKINTPIAVAPPSSGVTTPSTQGEGSGGAIQEDETDAADSAGNPSIIRRLIDSVFGTPSETQNGISPTTFTPAEKSGSGAVVQPTEASRRNSPQSVTEKPDSAPAESDEQPTLAPVTPTVPDSPPVVPTEWDPELIEPTDPPGESGTPWAPEPTDGGEPMYQEPTPVDFYQWIELSRLPENQVIYCKIYDNYGRLLGDGNLYTSEHVAEVDWIKKSRARMHYTTPEGMIWYSGYYNYVFYDENGTLLAQDQVYVHL